MQASVNIQINTNIRSIQCPAPGGQGSPCVLEIYGIKKLCERFVLRKCVSERYICKKEGTQKSYKIQV